MKNLFLTLLFLVIGSSAFCKVWTITNVNLTFSPDTLFIDLGDTVKFQVSSTHVPVEVSQATWLENGNTPLPGFSLSAGGGLVLPTQLTRGVHYYVCSPHAGMGMKGIILVKQLLGTEKKPALANISIYPNPSSGLINISKTNNLPLEVAVYNLLGERVYWSLVTEQNMVIEFNAPNGTYLYTLKDSKNHLSEGKITIQK